MQLRYGAPLLTADVQGRVPREQLAGESALVCFVANANAPSAFALVPVRFVTIIRAEQVGTSYIFTVAADAFVTDLTDTDIRAAASSADQQRLPAPLGASPIAGEIFAFSGKQAWRDYKSLSLNTFEATAERLTVHSSFNTPKSAFFTVVRVSEVRARSWFGSWPQPRKLNQGAFDLKNARLNKGTALRIGKAILQTGRIHRHFSLIAKEACHLKDVRWRSDPLRKPRTVL